MADTRINFRIGSMFSGEGFKKAEIAVKNSNKYVQAGKSAFGQLATAMGEAGSSAGKAMNAVSGLVGAFASGGIAGLAFAGGMAVINHALSEAEKRAEAARKKAEELREAMEKRFTNTLAEEMERLTKETRGLIADFDRVTAQAKVFTDAMTRLSAAHADSRISVLESEKFDAVTAAKTDAEKANVAAEMDLEIAKEKEKIAREKAAKALEAAETALKAGTDRIAYFDDALAKNKEELDKLYEIRGMTALSEKESEEIINQMNRIQEESSKLEKERAAQVEKNEILYRERNRAAIEERTVATRAALAVKAAEQSVRDVAAAGEKLAAEMEARAVEEKKAGFAAASAKAAEEARQAEAAHQKKMQAEETRLKKEAAGIQKNINENGREVSNAQAAYDRALADYNAHYGEEKINEFLRRKGFDEGKMLTAGERAALAGDIARDATMKQLKETGFKNVAAMERFQRQAERETAKQINAERVAQANDAARAERIMAMSPKARSKADQEWLAKWSALQDQKNARAAELDRRKQELDAARKRQEDLVKAAQSIDAKLKLVGLQ